MDFYQTLLKSDPLFEEIQALRKVNNNIEEKYFNEI